MPLYEYECGKCGAQTTAYRAIVQRNEGPHHCGATMAKVITAPMVSVDIPAYISPASGKVISSRVQRREDFKRTRTRPWEGLEAEKSEAAKVRAAADAKLDATLEKGVHEVLNNSSAATQQAIKTALPT